MKTMYFHHKKELKGIYYLPVDEFREQFPLFSGVADGMLRMVGYPLSGPGGPLPVTRVVQHRQISEPHRCDDRCMSAKGKICECSCGGVNHGCRA